MATGSYTATVAPRSINWLSSIPASMMVRMKSRVWPMRAVSSRALRAVPSPTGLVVRNVLLTRTVTWDEVSRVRFAGGDPWVVLDLADGEQLAVMAVQKSDGPIARSEGSRLAALVQAGRTHGR